MMSTNKNYPMSVQNIKHSPLTRNNISTFSTLTLFTSFYLLLSSNEMFYNLRAHGPSLLNNLETSLLYTDLATWWVNLPASLHLSSHQSCLNFHQGSSYRDLTLAPFLNLVLSWQHPILVFWVLEPWAQVLGPRVQFFL